MTQFLWILSPLAQYSLLALTLTACLALSLSLKREIDVVRRSSRDEATASAAALAAQLAALRRGSDDVEVAVPTGQDLNLTRRAQALRMQRRGESAATIAAALRVPRNEIDLLLKIQKLTTTHERPAAGVAG
jgi:cobalamin biosynthesis protein CbiD